MGQTPMKLGKEDQNKIEVVLEKEPVVNFKAKRSSRRREVKIADTSGLMDIVGSE